MNQIYLRTPAVLVGPRVFVRGVEKMLIPSIKSSFILNQMSWKGRFVARQGAEGVKKLLRGVKKFVSCIKHCQPIIHFCSIRQLPSICDKVCVVVFTLKTHEHSFGSLLEFFACSWGCSTVLKQ